MGNQNLVGDKKIICIYPDLMGDSENIIVVEPFHTENWVDIIGIQLLIRSSSATRCDHDMWVCLKMVAYPDMVNWQI